MPDVQELLRQPELLEESNHSQIRWLVFDALACIKIAVRTLLSPLFDVSRRIRIPPSPPVL